MHLGALNPKIQKQKKIKIFRTLDFFPHVFHYEFDVMVFLNFWGALNREKNIKVKGGWNDDENAKKRLISYFFP